MIFPAILLTIDDEHGRSFMEALYVEHHQLMFRTAYRAGFQKADVEDIVSQSCENLIHVLHQLEQMKKDRLQAYIVATVKNAGYTHRRKQQRAHEVPDAEQVLEKAEDENAEVDAELLKKCTAEEVERAMEKLSEDDQVVLRMKYFQQLSTAEMARQLEIREDAVRSRISRALRRMRKQLEEHDRR